MSPLHFLHRLSIRKRIRLLRFGGLVGFIFITITGIHAGLIGYSGEGGWLSAGSGLNLELPPAHLPKVSPENKLAYYLRADRDSQRRRQAELSDPYYHPNPAKMPSELPLLSPAGDLKNRQAGKRSAGRGASPGAIMPPLDVNDSSISALRQLALLRRVLQNPVAERPALAGPGDSGALTEAALPSVPVTAPDPEIAQLDKLMDKILAVQHSGGLAVKKSPDSAETTGYPVSRVKRQPGGVTHQLSAQSAISPDTGGPVTLKAYVPQTQHLHAGSEIRLALEENLYVKGRRVVRGSLVYGVVRLSGERLLVHVSSLLAAGDILPVSLTVYDLDGLKGIHVPDAGIRKAAKASGAGTLEDIRLGGVSTSWEAEAAGAGLRAARHIVGRKLRQPTVTVPAGYELLLREAAAFR